MSTTTDGQSNAARFVTTLADTQVLAQTVIADGADHAVDDAECRGTQRAEFSADGLRLYSRAELSCRSDQTTRRVFGLTTFAPDGAWIDIQAIEVGERENLRVRRYRRVADAATAPLWATGESG